MAAPQGRTVFKPPAIGATGAITAVKPFDPLLAINRIQQRIRPMRCLLRQSQRAEWYINPPAVFVLRKQKLKHSSSDVHLATELPLQCSRMGVKIHREVNMFDFFFKSETAEQGQRRPIPLVSVDEHDANL
jgi:hypothetical protein